MIQISIHVMPPGNRSQFIPEEDHRPLKSAGLGYSVMNALGAHKGISEKSLEVIRDWCREHCERYPNIVPDERALRRASFEERLFRVSTNAVMNAVCYPGLNGKPSYQDLHRMVWIEQRWPELCRALGNGF